MKKLFVLFLSVFFVFSFALSGCDNTPDLTDYLTELRQDVYHGENGDISLSSAYGFNKSKGDGYFMTFKLNNPLDIPVTYTLTFNHDKTYTKQFEVSPVTHSLTASIELEKFDKAEFTVDVSYGSETVTVQMQSLRPSETMGYRDALNSLKTSQPTLIQNYVKDGLFTASICMRLSVKDGKPYYYVAFTDTDKNVKAFLLDGISAKVLAVREIF